MEDAEIQERLANLQGWSYQDNSLSKQFSFADFLASVGFVNKIAPLAEEINHHPDLKIEYSKVTVTLTTHDQASVTNKDFELASKIDQLV